MKHQYKQYLKSADGLGSNPIPETNKQYKFEQLVQPLYASFGIFKRERITYLKGLFIYLTNIFIVLRKQVPF